MNFYINPARESWAGLCTRPADNNPAIREKVAAIIERVRCKGDVALAELSREIDGYAPDGAYPRVSAAEIKEAGELVSPALKQAIDKAIANISAFHKAQMPAGVDVTTCEGVRCIQRPVAIRNVGIYVPGGTAPLFSTVLMLAVPAKIAGCKKVVMCTPCSKEGKVAPTVLYAASRCGVDEIFKIGGAQAVAAMAYGTQSVPAVDKIFGPGNQWVTTAKQIVSGSKTAIDMPAGPSEVMVIADSSASAESAAADLLSQAEHGRDSQVVLLSDDKAFAQKVIEAVDRQKETLDRVELANCALEKSRSIVFSDRNDIIDFANQYAPEHLIILTQDAWDIANKIECAGSVFIGHYTPESAGDYASGTNHTLPTSAWAHSYSGVNLDSYMRKMTLQEITQEGLEKLGGTIMEMARAEGLGAHAYAVEVRLKK